MLNLLRSSKLEFRQSCIEYVVAVCLGVLMVAVMLVLDETDAQQNMARHIFNLPRLGAAQHDEVVPDAEVAHAQLELARAKSRALYLMRRQEERDDLIDVQAIWAAHAWGQKAAVGELSALQWHQGKLAFEGLIVATEDWHSLTSDMNMFDRWKARPQIFHAHRAETKSSPSEAHRVEVKLTAHLWAHASNALPNQTAP